MTLTYADGTTIQVNDVVRRGKIGKARYRVVEITEIGREPVVGLYPISGFTRASVFGIHAIRNLVKEDTWTPQWSIR